MNTKSTLVIGASTNPERYSYKAIQMLRAHGVPTFAYGLKPGTVSDVTFTTTQDIILDIDTVTMYVGPANQKNVEDYILRLHPRRVIFNPGTENLEFQKLLQSKGIETEDACTLVLLSTHAF